MLTNLCEGFLPGMRAIPKEKNDLLTDEEKAVFDKTELGQSIIESQRIFCKYREEPEAREVLEYWQQQGCVKRYFKAGTGGTQGEFSLFYPSDLKAGEKLPLLYILRGRNHPLGLAETYGFNSLIASMRFAAVYPAAFRSSADTASEQSKIEEYIKDILEIDRSRIYLFGFAAGSDAAANLALADPAHYAAISPSPGGHCFYASVSDESDDRLNKLREAKMPVICVGGTRDGDCFPNENSTPEQLRALTAWLNACGAGFAEAPTMDYFRTARSEAAKPAVPELGLPFDRFSVYTDCGTDWLCGENTGEGGAALVKWIRCRGLSHYMCPAAARAVWKFMSAFRRGKSGHPERL